MLDLVDARANGDADPRGAPRPRPAFQRVPLCEVVFASVLLWVLIGGQAGALLADGDTGWHIRTGDYILEQRRFPTRDLFSFSRPGAEWFAWEWGSDVLFSLANRAAGLKGVVLLAGTVIAATSAALFQFMLWQRVNVILAVAAALAAASASSTHWLARPHIFTCLFFLLSLWLLERDRRRPSRWIWALAPGAALWANLHGGFLVLTAMLLVYLLGSAGEAGKARRYARLLVLSCLATLLNPYGYRLHLHIWQYLRSDFIRNHVQEFGPPRFRGESMLVFELLLAAGLMAVPSLWRRRDYITALLVAAMAHAALSSQRHILLYVLAATPPAARELTSLLERGPWAFAVRSLAADYALQAGAPRGFPLPVCGLASIVLAGALLGSGPARWRVEFPKEKFPQAALARTEEITVGKRVFSSDQWSDYLIYRLYPRVRVFIDGRSDFYGASIGTEYLEAQQAQYRWEDIVNRYGFDVALLPAEWPLATLLKAHPGWRLEYDDGQALVLTRLHTAMPPYRLLHPNQDRRE